MGPIVKRPVQDPLAVLLLDATTDYVCRIWLSGTSVIQIPPVLKFCEQFLAHEFKLRFDQKNFTEKSPTFDQKLNPIEGTVLNKVVWNFPIK